MRVAIIGSNQGNEILNAFAYRAGRFLMDEGHTIINGGMGGIMEASAKGAHSSPSFEPHRLIAILPLENPSKGNAHSGVKIATHLGKGRNYLIILNAEAVLAIGGGAGTLNEMATAWELNRPIAAFVGGGGWSEELAGKSIDSRRKDTIYPVHSIDDLRDWLLTHS
ncbi:MAG: TIGR00725 family protein [Methanobacteriota archaeon]|nr:MAG: TIGR00725 family protein [Euryarchaeota archaeon]